MRKSGKINRIEVSKSSIRSYINIFSRIIAKVIESIIIMAMHINGRSVFSNYEEFIDTIKELRITLNVKVRDYTNDEINYTEEYSIITDI